MSGDRFSHLLRADLADISAYVPHTGQFPVRLDANEAPPLLSAESRAKLAEALAATAWERYPDVRASELRALLAARHGVSEDQLLIGCGSDEVIALLLTALDRPRDGARAATVLTTTPTFVMYKISAKTRGIRVLEVPLDATWDLDVAQLTKAIEFGRPNVVFIATPNNPTGNLMARDRLEAVIAGAPEALVVVDEAYIDYASRTQLDLLARYPNVAILRTVSKIGLAALRVGWIVAPAELVREVDKVRQPYNLSVPAQKLATVALRDLHDDLARSVATVVAERGRVAAAIGGMGGFVVTPSEANFLWVTTPVPAGALHARMAEQGVLVRSFHAAGGRLGHQLRITIGTRAENDRLLEVLAACV